MLIHPTGPNPRCGPTGIEVLGDPEAVGICSAMMKAHGFKPVVRDGGLDVAPLYEVSTLGRVMKDHGAPPGPGQDSDGLIGPFNASPMLALDVVGEKLSRLFWATPSTGTREQQADQVELGPSASAGYSNNTVPACPMNADALQVQLSALKDSDWSRRKAAAQTLRDMGPGAVGAVSELSRVLKGDSDWGTRCAAAEALGRIGSGASQAIPDLLEATKDSDWTVRSAAQQALKSIQ